MEGSSGLKGELTNKAPAAVAAAHCWTLTAVLRDSRNAGPDPRGHMKIWGMSWDPARLLERGFRASRLNLGKKGKYILLSASPTK